jgi:hypothetical protein
MPLANTPQQIGVSPLAIRMGGLSKSTQSRYDSTVAPPWFELLCSPLIYAHGALLHTPGVAAASASDVMPEMSSRLDNIVMVVEKVVLDQFRIDGWRTGRFDARKWVEDTHVERSPNTYCKPRPTLDLDRGRNSIWIALPNRLDSGDVRIAFCVVDERPWLGRDQLHLAGLRLSPPEERVSSAERP